MGTEMSVRRNRVPPGTTIDLGAATPEERIASVQYLNDYNYCKRKLDELRRQWEADGADAFEHLAHAWSHNWAVGKGTNRLKAKGSATVKAGAQKRYAKILKAVANAGSVKAVVIDAQARKRKVRGRSERTIRRALKKVGSNRV